MLFNTINSISCIFSCTRITYLIELVLPIRFWIWLWRASSHPFK